MLYICFFSIIFALMSKQHSTYYVHYNMASMLYLVWYEVIVNSTVKIIYNIFQQRLCITLMVVVFVA